MRIIKILFQNNTKNTSSNMLRLMLLLIYAATNLRILDSSLIKQPLYGTYLIKFNYVILYKYTKQTTALRYHAPASRSNN